MLSLPNGMRSPHQETQNWFHSRLRLHILSELQPTLHVGLNGTKLGLPWVTSGEGEEVGGDCAEAQVSRPMVSTQLCVTVRLRLVCLPNAHRHTACVSVTRRPNSTHVPDNQEQLLFADLPLSVPQTHISPLIEACSQANVIWGNLPRVPGVGLEAMGSAAVHLPPGVSVSLEQEPHGAAFPPNEQHPGQLLGWRVDKQACEPAAEATSPSLGPHPTPLTNLAQPDSSTRQSDDGHPRWLHAGLKRHRQSAWGSLQGGC